MQNDPRERKKMRGTQIPIVDNQVIVKEQLDYIVIPD
jgi:hypothetical protein